MCERNLFDSFSTRDNYFHIKPEPNYPVIDLTENYSPFNSERESNIMVREELQSIDIFSDYEYEGLKQFRDENDLDSDSEANVESVLSENELIDENYMKDEISNYKSPNKLYTSRKLETKLPCLLIDKMESSSESEMVELSENDHKPPIQIEIDSGLPDLKKSEIITKQDLVRLTFKKSKPLLKEVSFRLNSKRKQTTELMPNIIETVAKNVNENIQSNRTISKSQDRSIFENNKARLKSFSLKITGNTITNYYLLVDVSHVLGLGIIEFIRRFLNQISYIEISVSEFNARCHNPDNIPDAYFSNSGKNHIISFVEINDNLNNLFDNFPANSQPGNGNQYSHYCNFGLEGSVSELILTNAISFKTGTNTTNYVDSKFYNASNKVVSSEQSRRKQILLPRLNNIENTGSLTFYHKNQVKILGLLYDLQLMTELTLRNVNDSGARAILEHLEKPLPIIDRFISQNFISYQVILGKIKEGVEKFYDQGILLINHLRILNEVKNVSNIIANTDSLMGKMLNVIREITSLQCSFVMVDSKTRNASNSTISREALKITIFSYQLIDLIKEFSRDTHQILISNSF